MASRMCCVYQIPYTRSTVFNCYKKSHSCKINFLRSKQDNLTRTSGICTLQNINRKLIADKVELNQVNIHRCSYD